ncbi:hypothetical protein P154DRAFT_573674 [Amniculicola lignicola CBS 123094]|uniref:Uncharacterized protein n=1 Tax=Amniculicola lignicola CBS 123094 TaxID=1392246 RepID=A0A6A5WZ65_9PLEO|nr:hypothetical protein P154DRAFT_573674 [Amniculicola lignicola CBS 123094]
MAGSTHGPALQTSWLSLKLASKRHAGWFGLVCRLETVFRLARKRRAPEGDGRCASLCEERAKERREGGGRGAKEVQTTQTRVYVWIGSVGLTSSREIRDGG